MLRKKIITLISITLLCTFTLGIGVADASNDYRGKVVKMNGLSTLYYVASDGKRYVFPNEKTYSSWFINYDEVTTIPKSELTSMTLGGNVRYRPGALLVKITTDPRVYVVSKGGILRWLKTESVAKSLYGDHWNKLIDDIPDSFFTNYQIGDDIGSVSDFDPEDEVDEIDNIDKDYGFSYAKALKAQTRRCRIVSNKRDCNNSVSNTDDSEDDETTVDNDDDTAPYITSITISNQGEKGYIDADDRINITFSEAIDPSSINSGLEADGEFASLSYDINGAVTVDYQGILTIKNIASFDIGSVSQGGDFAVRLNLSSNARNLYITLLSAYKIKITDEDFEEANQIGGIVTDEAGNAMEDDSDIGVPDGSFGGVNLNDGVEPYITGIKVYNYGEDDYIDEDDEIKITFSEEIDPDSINDDLKKGGTVNNVDADETGGVIVNTNGILVITDIASFYVGDVDGGETFDVTLKLNEQGDILTIVLDDDDKVFLENEDLDDAEQIGDIVEDTDGNEMDDDPKINDPTGTFIGDSESSDLYISYIKAYNNGYSGFIDEGDTIVITFSMPIDLESVDIGPILEYGETGGVYIDDDGLLTVTDIFSFDIGTVGNSSEFETKLTISSNHKVLTVTLFDGDAVRINSENFSNTNQIGGYILDEDALIVLENESDIDNPSGTFGGDSTEMPPYITEIEIDNGGSSSHIDVNDRIIITFNEAIDPDSIDNDLELDDAIHNVDDDDTGGVIVSDEGILTVTDIAEFYVGNVEDDTEFEVSLSLNLLGNVLTITLTEGDSIEITYPDIDDAEQIGGTIEDEEGNEMEDDPRISDPDGNF